MKAENAHSEPTIVLRDPQCTMGIRATAPFRGMFAEVTVLRREVGAWASKARLENAGPYLLRYHVVDMKGTMAIEVGLKVAAPLEGTDRIEPGFLPGGAYATLTYRGNGRVGNAALLDWIAAQGLTPDLDRVPEGDRFACRYEAFLTDPRIEPRKLLQDIELSIKLRD